MPLYSDEIHSKLLRARRSTGPAGSGRQVANLVELQGEGRHAEQIRRGILFNDLIILIVILFAADVDALHEAEPALAAHVAGSSCWWKSGPKVDAETTAF
jgi:hypothetical protein